jgi:hypothetical protein
MSRQQTVRRLYVYLVALISFAAALFAVDGLLQAMVDAWISGPSFLTVTGTGFVRRAIAANMAMLLVAVPVFLIHWALAQSRVDDPEQRGAAMRKFYLYAASAVSLGFVLVRANGLLSGIARLALGEPTSRSPILPSAWLHFLGMVLTSALCLYYWQATARSDGDYGGEEGLAAVWRRIYLAAFALVGLAMVIFGSAGLINAMLQALLERSVPSISWAWLPVEAGVGLSTLLVGALTAHVAWSAWQDVVRASPDEGSSALLHLYLYIAVIGGAVATLVPVAILVRRALLWVFGGLDDPALTADGDITSALSFLPAGVMVWRSHWRILETLEVRDVESPESIAVRRIYYYAVAATGLVLLWIGLVNVLQVVIDMVVTAGQVKDSMIWQRPLATGLSLLVVGAPVWAYHWRSVQAIALQTTPEGAAERASLPRRVYLYAVAFVGAVLVIVFLALVVYRVFLYAMGDPNITLMSTEFSEDIARSLIAAALWAVHLGALRTDQRLSAASPTSSEARRVQLTKRIASLEMEVTGLRRELNALDEGSLAGENEATQPATLTPQT